MGGQYHLQREHEARELAAGRDAGERARLHSLVQLHLENHVLRTMCAVRRALCAGQRHLEPPAFHAQRRQNLVHGATQLLGPSGTLRSQRCGGARKFVGGFHPIRADVAQVEIGGVEQLELARRGVARGQHIGNRRPVLLLQPKQQVAPLLHGTQARRVRFDVAGVGPRRLRELGSARERRVEQLLPLPE